MRVYAVCDQCNQPIVKSNYWRYKNDFEEHFCSVDCINRNIIENTEIREDWFEEDVGMQK